MARPIYTVKDHNGDQWLVSQEIMNVLLDYTYQNPDSEHRFTLVTSKETDENKEDTSIPDKYKNVTTSRHRLGRDQRNVK